MMVGGTDIDPVTGAPEYTPAYYSGIGLTLAGEGMIVAGIVTGIIGKNRVRSAVNQYNSKQHQGSLKPPITIQVGMASNGLGLRLNF